MELKKILVIEDDKKTSVLISDLLHSWQYHVLNAENGQRGLDIIEEGEPDLILLDVMMPVMDGFSFLSYFRKDNVYDHIPVIMLTALGDNENQVKAITQGANDYIAKPFNKLVLKARVQSFLKVKSYNDISRRQLQEVQQNYDISCDSIREAYNKLTQSSKEIILRMARAVEYKDRESRHHIERVAHITEILAQAYGLDEANATAFQYASTMHDVGNIAIPDSILFKKEKLNPKEWEIIKKHTSIGKKILEGSEFGYIKMAEIIAYTHHERWDGKGYPRKLRDTDIPIGGRIVALVDVFDSLISDRVYRQAYSISEALGVIVKESGKHFEPRLVKLFQANMKKITVVVDKYPPK